MLFNVYTPCFCSVVFFCSRIHRSKKNRGNNHQSLGFPYQLRVDLQPTNPISSGSSHPPDGPAETSDVTKGGFWRCVALLLCRFFVGALLFPGGKKAPDDGLEKQTPKLNLVKWSWLVSLLSRVVGLPDGLFMAYKCR